MSKFTKAGLVLLLLLLCQQWASGLVLYETETELAAQSDLVVEGEVVLIENYLPGHPKIRRITLEVFNVLQGTAADTIRIIQRRSDQDTTWVVPDLAEFALHDSCRVYLIEIPGSDIYDFDGVTVLNLPPGLYFHVIYGEMGKHPVGGSPEMDGAEDDSVEGHQEPGESERGESESPFDYLGSSVMLDEKCCVYVNIAADAFDDLTVNGGGNDINFTAVDKTWIRAKVVELITQDFNIPDCPIKVTTDPNGCDGAEFKVTIAIGGNAPFHPAAGHDNYQGIAPRAKPGNGCITGHTVYVYTQEFGFERGNGAWVSTRERMAQAVGNAAAHEAGHQFGAEHLRNGDQNTIMLTGSQMTKNAMATNNKTFDKAAKNKIRECCCPRKCINVYALLDKWGRRITTYKTKQPVKVYKTGGAQKEHPAGSNTWVGVTEGEVLPSGTRVRVPRGGRCEVIPYEAPKMYGEVSLDGTVHIDLEYGYLEIDEWGDCIGVDHCAGQTAVASFHIPMSNADSAATVMELFHSYDLGFSRVCNSIGSVFDVEFELSVGPDSGTVHSVPPGNCAEISAYGDVIPSSYGPVVVIESILEAELGSVQDLSIGLGDCPIEIGQFELLLSYDPTALTLISAQMGQMLEQCEWEYFTYRFLSGGGYVRFTGVASVTSPNPLCYGPFDMDLYELVSIQFLVSDDSELLGTWSPVQFYWLSGDCDANLIVDASGSLAGCDLAVRDSDEHTLWDEENDVLFPEGSRPEGTGTPDECMGSLPPGAERIFVYRHGGIGIGSETCCIPPTVGDVDLSGVVDITDVSVLIDNQFLSLTPLACHDEGDIDFSGTVDITDLSVLIDNQFLTLTPLPPCP